MIMPDKKIEQKNQVKIPRKNPAKKYIGGFQHDWFQRQAGYMPQFPMEAVGLGKRGVLAMDLCSGSPTVARSEGCPIPLLRPRIPGIIPEKPGINHIFPPFLRRKIRETNSINWAANLFQNGLW